MKRLVIIGMDGLDKEVLDSLLKGNKLPNFAKLISQGKYSVLFSSLPAHSGPAWTTILTGLDPGAHGIYDFTTFTNPPRLNSSQDIKTSTILDILSQYGKIISIGVPMTYPPWKINGVMVSGFPTPSTTSLFTYPAEVGRELLERNYKNDNIGITALSPLRDPKGLYEKYIRNATSVKDAAFYLMGKYPDWLLSFVVFDIPDRIHHFWLDVKTNERVVSTYVLLDSFLGEFMQRYTDENTSILLLSDHGGEPIKKYFTLPRWLQLAKLRNPSWKARLYGHVYRISSSSRIIAKLTSYIPAKSFNKNFSIETRPKENSDIEVSSLGYISKRASPMTHAELGLALEGLKMVTYQGKSVVKAIHDLRQIYSPNETNPDFLVELEPGFMVNDMDGLRLFYNRPRSIVGDHNRTGVIIVTGALAQSCTLSDNPNVIDIAPTILQFLTNKSTKTMKGKSFISNTANEIIDDTIIKTSENQSAFTSDEEQMLEEHLKSLGYV